MSVTVDSKHGWLLTCKKVITLLVTVVAKSVVPSADESGTQLSSCNQVVATWALCFYFPRRPDINTIRQCNGVDKQTLLGGEIACRHNQVKGVSGCV